MKLQELAVANPTKQIAKVFESYFGSRIKFDAITPNQARSLLTRVRSLVREHRRTPEFHASEQNPAYLKLVMMEQVLSTKIQEEMPVQPGAQATAAAPAVNPANVAMNMAAKKKQAQETIKSIDDQIKSLQAQRSAAQQQANSPMESRLYRRLHESEVQQAQVVLASQDMVDQVQKMLEQVSAMQFKDLPALVDQVKNQVGVDQAMQFNTDASAALTGMIQNLQASKQQLEGALGVVTGQAPVVPGDAEVAAPEMGGEELPAPADVDVDIDAEMDANVGAPAASLGRGRR